MKLCSFQPEAVGAPTHGMSTEPGIFYLVSVPGEGAGQAGLCEEEGWGQDSHSRALTGPAVDCAAVIECSRMLLSWLFFLTSLLHVLAPCLVPAVGSELILPLSNP